MNYSKATELLWNMKYRPVGRYELLNGEPFNMNYSPFGECEWITDF